MTGLHRILYATIKNWELEERLRREDYSFDAFDFLSDKIGHKNSSTLRKMCTPRSNNNDPKLGVEDALAIMNVTHDYRLLLYMQEELKHGAKANEQQLDLFSQPIRSLEPLTSNQEYRMKKI